MSSLNQQHIMYWNNNGLSKSYKTVQLNQQHIMYWNGVTKEDVEEFKLEPTTYNVLK